MAILTGKRAMVTGGASGIGLAISRLFVEEGAEVIIADINDDAGKARADDLGDLASYQRLDIANPEEWESAFKDFTIDRRLDILVNNAGIFQTGDIESLELSVWERMSRINVGGVFLGCQSAIRHMKNNQSGGSIVNISSMTGNIGSPDYVAYAASKAAVTNITKSVTAHCGQQHYPIRCNSIHPSIVDTPLMRNGLGEETVAMLQAQEMDFASPDEIAPAALYLASPQSARVSGLELIVDSGALAGNMWLRQD